MYMIFLVCILISLRWFITTVSTVNRYNLGMFITMIPELGMVKSRPLDTE